MSPTRNGHLAIPELETANDPRVFESVPGRRTRLTTRLGGTPSLCATSFILFMMSSSIVSVVLMRTSCHRCGREDIIKAGVAA